MDDKIITRVAYSTGNSAVNGSYAISIPRPPWEKGDELPPIDRDRDGQGLRSRYLGRDNEL